MAAACPGGLALSLALLLKVLCCFSASTKDAVSVLAQLGGVAKPCLVKTGPKQRELSQEARPAQQKRRRYLASDSKGEGTVASVACVQSAMQSTFAREGFLDLRADSATPPSFSLLALGTGGGPVEDNLSAYWVKPASSPWSKGFVSIDGGSCLGALTRLLKSHQDAFLDFDLPSSTSTSALAKAGYIYGLLASFLVTHAHWDHISGLVLSCGSAPGSQKSVYGSKQTLANLSEAMNGGLWPVLGSYTEGQGVPYVWRLMEPSKEISPLAGLRASLWPVSHGRHHNNTSYQSSAFFVNNEETGRSFLIFGDVEADSVSGESFNRRIWEETAMRIRRRNLDTIFLECSYSSSRKREQLYGHLSPPYLMEELRVLADVLKSTSDSESTSRTGQLAGLNICIIHVKDPTGFEMADAHTHDLPQSRPAQPEASLAASSASASVASTPLRRRTRSATKEEQSQIAEASMPDVEQSNEEVDLESPEGIRKKIYTELLQLEETERLGMRFVMVEQGMRIDI